ncbi:hypothetical protein [Nostoc sp. 'Lobaria pulmonaria (5183) cyanobiont']|uniref:hypothetical protein n=1 Tax=Nostoc sp. 'Lobaria pulmonaria (5183) cyanobiont' TaxID=1618022 RepID=UPI001319E55F|nr:hypothetical protein [Nostoc sp. 'Lobaria pulmonaria (5183) cyanobiont']
MTFDFRLAVLVASPSNTPPVANPDSVTTTKNIATNIAVATLRANDSDAARRQEVETIFI